MQVQKGKSNPVSAFWGRSLGVSSTWGCSGCPLPPLPVSYNSPSFISPWWVIATQQTVMIRPVGVDNSLVCSWGLSVGLLLDRGRRACVNVVRDHVGSACSCSCCKASHRHCWQCMQTPFAGFETGTTTGRIDVVTHRIDTGSASPIKQKPHRRSAGAHQAVVNPNLRQPLVA